MRELKLSVPKVARLPLAVAVLALVVVAFPLLTPRAQRSSRESGVNVTGVSSRPSGANEVVSISADAPLSRAQTWQDEEGFHVVGFKWVGAFGAAPRGVKVRRVGDSLELVLPVNRGASVTVSPRANSLDLIVSGGMRAGVEADERRQRATAVKAAREVTREARQKVAGGRAGVNQSVKQPSGEEILGMRLPSLVSTKGQKEPGAGAARVRAAKNVQQANERPAQVKRGSEGATRSTVVQTMNPPSAVAESGTVGAAAQNTTADALPAPSVVIEASTADSQTSATPPLVDASQSESGVWGGLTFAVIAAIFGIGLAVFLLINFNQRRTPAAVEAVALEVERIETAPPAKRNDAKFKNTHGKNSEATPQSAKHAAKVEAEQGLARREGRPPAQAAAATVMFGAFRVEQEVDKLMRGAPHAIEVLASRASDDRRAVEASLLKALGSPEVPAAERARARVALEEYGFVARQSASLLLAPDAYERSAAARTLGQVKSEAALPFLLEALYDPDTVVRTEAVASLGTLGLPRAIGALLDTARRHADLPAVLVSRALNSCSVDAVDLGPVDGFALALEGGFDGEINGLNPVEEIAQLPEWLEDETLVEALARLGADDVETRVAAAQQLAQFQVQRAVDALASMVARDMDASVRAAAITSLGLIGHESVFASILIAMGDEAREVRAAAARGLSRLNFDRADAYVRVLETADEDTLRLAAESCVAAGLARQAMDRLASEDRRQAYEAFSLLSLVARGGQTEVILQVVANHPDLGARLAAARLLGLQGESEVCDRLRQIALEGHTPEKLREAILEVADRRKTPRDEGQPAAEYSLPTNEDDKSAYPIA